MKKLSLFLIPTIVILNACQNTSNVEIKDARYYSIQNLDKGISVIDTIRKYTFVSTSGAVYLDLSKFKDYNEAFGKDPAPYEEKKLVISFIKDKKEGTFALSEKVFECNKVAKIN